MKFVIATGKTERVERVAPDGVVSYEVVPVRHTVDVAMEGSLEKTLRKVKQMARECVVYPAT